MLNYFKLGILTTRKCNQCCYYCNNYNTNSDKTIIDIDYLLWILKIYNNNNINNLYIELSGGEPSLIENISDVIQILHNINYVTKIDILSNGLFRKKYYNLLDYYTNLTCIEHNCLNINNKTINYFYNDITFFNNKYNNVEPLIVLDELTLDSLINNFNYFNNIQLFNNKVDFKILTPKLTDLTDDLLNKYNIFYQLLKDNYLNYRKIFNDYLFLKRKPSCNINNITACAKVSSMQYIDLENKKLGQCSMNVVENQNVDINEKNIHDAIIGKLFNKSEYCNKCIKYDENAYKYLLMRLKNKNDCNISDRKVNNDT